MTVWNCPDFEHTGEAAGICIVERFIRSVKQECTRRLKLRDKCPSYFLEQKVRGRHTQDSEQRQTDEEKTQCLRNIFPNAAIRQ